MVAPGMPKPCEKCGDAPRVKSERFCQRCRGTVLAAIRPFLQEIEPPTRSAQAGKGRYNFAEGDEVWMAYEGDLDD